jgi:leader peptidase (prepilin peptidase)/N-methyltransferase
VRDGDVSRPGAIAMMIALGLSVGSFLNVCIFRLPRGASLLRPRSRCPGCEYQLRWYDNIPVVSYLLLAGRCRSCRSRINLRYPVVEILTAIIFVAHYEVFGLTALLVVRLLFACALIVLFAIDLEHQILPNVITLPGIVGGLILSLVFPPGVLDAALGVLLGGGVLWLIGEAYYRVAGQEGMGGGDVKMLAMVGAFLGWKQVILTLIVSSIAGSLLGLLLILSRRGNMKQALPFGTFIAIGALLSSLVGERIVQWYAGMFVMSFGGVDGLMPLIARLP